MEHEMTSSEQILLEETKTLSETERMQQNVLNKMGRRFSLEMEEQDENENVYVKISEACKSEAARQSNTLLQVAEGLCSEKSPTLQRKGKMFKKLAPEVEKHVFNEMQKDLCQNLWQVARQRVYGTPCYYGSVTNCETTDSQNENV